MNAVSDSGLDTNQLQTQMEGKFYFLFNILKIYNIYFKVNLLKCQICE